MNAFDLVVNTPSGLYCPEGQFFIDPWKPVERAIVTHAHSDHATAGSSNYLSSRRGAEVLRSRLGSGARIEALEYGCGLSINGVRLSLHPAGHILGSAQVRLEYRGRVCVISGDFKCEPDRTCDPFELLSCHTFITESTFGMPVFRWPREQDVFEQITGWWSCNRELGRTSLLFAYSLGKAQRVLAGVDPSIGPIFCHGAVENMNTIYRREGVSLPPTRGVDEAQSKGEFERALVLAPPIASGTRWMRRFPEASTGFVSGWMAIRGMRRRRAVDRGFVLSDHADWPGLVETIQGTKADQTGVTHGFSAVLVRWLREQGRTATEFSTRFAGELSGEQETHGGE